MLFRSVTDGAVLIEIPGITLPEIPFGITARPETLAKVPGGYGLQAITFKHYYEVSSTQFPF